VTRSAPLRATARRTRDSLAAYAHWLAAEAVAFLARGPAAGERGGRRLMLVSSLFPPRVAAGTHRVLALVRHGAAAGWDVTVVTGPSRPPTEAGAYLTGMLPPGARVERHPEPLLTPGRLFPRIDGSLLGALAMFEAGRRAAAEAPPAVVLATGPSFHTFPAARLLARALGCRLVLEYRDEWTECPFDFVTPGRADRWWERRCLRAADAVVFTTRAQRDHQLRVFRELDSARCHVIPNGWDDDAEPATDGDAPEDGSGPLTLSYVGSLGSWTPPTAFLSALRAVVERRPDLARRLKVRIVGLKSPAVLRELEAFPHRDLLDVIDLVPKPVASTIMRASAALLLFNDNPAMARYIPSKLYEYVGAGRPVLLFADGGETGALVRELGAGLVVPSGDPRALEAALESIARGEAAAGPPGSIEAWRRRHTREELARETFRLLDRVATEGRRGR
jgi:glycosyltransferase involved in cell wall biosynthesis